MSNRKKGFTLIEIVLAIALLLIAMGGIAAVIIGTKNSSEKLFTEGDLQQQLVEVQDSLQDEMLATNVGIKYWVKSGDEWIYPKAETEQEGVPKLFAVYNVDYIDYVLKKQYMYYEPDSKKLYYGDLSEPLDMSQTKAYTLNVDPVPQDVIDSLNDKWTVSSLKVTKFEIDSFVFGKKRLLPYRISIEQDDVEYKASDTVNIRNEIKVNEPMVIDPAQTAKITKPVLEGTMFTYNGQEQGPQEKYFNSRYVRRIAGSNLKAKNAGNYYVTYQLTQQNARWADGSQDEITYTWEILPRELTLTWGTTLWTYDGQAHSTEVTFDHSVLVPGEDLVITLNNNSIGPNVGETTVTAVPSSNNYKIKSDANAHQIIKIKEATASWDTEIQPRNYVYDGNYHILTTTSYTVGGTAKYRLVRYINSEGTIEKSDQDWDTAPLTGDKAGSYVIECKIDIGEDHNYVEPKTKTVTAIISKANPVLTDPVINTDLVYNGDKQSLFSTLPSAPPGLVINYSINGAEYTTNPPKGINAGTYTIKYQACGGDDDSKNNYNASEEKEVKVTIKKSNKAKYTQKPRARSPLTYNGAEQELVIAGSTNDGIIVYYLDGAHRGFVPKKTNAGTYYCTYQIEGDSNHENSAPKTLTITIEKADGLPPNPAPTAKDLTYDGSAQSLINPGTATTGTLVYSLDQNTWSRNVPQRTDAGSYRVYYKVVGDSNHKDTPVYSILATIKERPIVVNIPRTLKTTYTGSGQNVPPVSTLPIDCTVRYGTTAGVYNLTTPPSYTNANTYKIYYSVQRNGYTSVTGSYNFTIDKAQPVFRTRPTANPGLIFRNKDQNLIIPGTTSCGTIYYSFYSNVGFSTSIPQASNPDTYRVYYKVMGNDNYWDTVYYLDVTIGDSVLVGDANLDGKISVDDANAIQQYASSSITFNSKQMKAADANCDGSVGIDDATVIQRYLASLFDENNSKVGTWIAY